MRPCKHIYYEHFSVNTLDLQRHTLWQGGKLGRQATVTCYATLQLWCQSFHSIFILQCDIFNSTWTHGVNTSDMTCFQGWKCGLKPYWSFDNLKLGWNLRCIIFFFSSSGPHWGGSLGFWSRCRNSISQSPRQAALSLGFMCHECVKKTNRNLQREEKGFGQVNSKITSSKIWLGWGKTI